MALTAFMMVMNGGTDSVSLASRLLFVEATAKFLQVFWPGTYMDS